MANKSTLIDPGIDAILNTAFLEPPMESSVSTASSFTFQTNPSDLNASERGFASSLMTAVSSSDHLSELATARDSLDCHSIHSRISIVNSHISITELLEESIMTAISQNVITTCCFDETADLPSPSSLTITDERLTSSSIEGSSIASLTRRYLTDEIEVAYGDGSKQPQPENVI